MIQRHDPTLTELTNSPCEEAGFHAECRADVHEPWCFDGTECESIDEDGNDSECACHDQR